MLLFLDFVYLNGCLFFYPLLVITLVTIYVPYPGISCSRDLLICAPLHRVSSAVLPSLGARAYLFLNVAAGKVDNQFPYQLEAVGVMGQGIFFLHPHHETADEGGVITYVPLMFSGLPYPQLCLKCQLCCAA